jgi:hypothetical protein
MTLGKLICFKTVLKLLQGGLHEKDAVPRGFCSGTERDQQSGVQMHEPYRQSLHSDV